MSADIDRWYQAIIFGSAIITTLSESTSRFGMKLANIRFAPRKIREAARLLAQFHLCLQWFSEVLATIRPNYIVLEVMVDIVKVATKRMRVFEHILLHYEETSRDAIDNFTKNPISGFIRFKFFGQYGICELQTAIQHMGTHLVNAYTQLTTTDTHQEIQYKQAHDFDSQNTIKNRAILQLAPVELESQSRCQALKSSEVGTWPHIGNSHPSRGKAVELEGSSVPLQANRRDPESPTLSDHTQELTLANSRVNVGFTCQDSMCDRIDLRSEFAKSLPDLCTLTCHLGQHQSTSATPNCDLQDSCRSVTHKSSSTNTLFSIGPPGWVDPITSYCNTVSRLFVCKVCGCHLECCYTTYRAFVESHAQYLWHRQFYFGRLLIDTNVPFLVFRATFELPEVASESPVILVYTFTDCLILAHDPTLPIFSLLGSPDHTDTARLPKSTCIRPIVRIHFSSIAHVCLMQATTISITTKRTIRSEFFSISLAPLCIDDYDLLVRTIISWSGDVAQTSSG